MRIFLAPSTWRLHSTYPTLFYTHPSSLRLLPPLSPFSFLFSFSLLFSSFLSFLFLHFFSFLSLFLSPPLPFSPFFFPTAPQFYRQYPDRWGLSHPTPPLETPLYMCSVTVVHVWNARSQICACSARVVGSMLSPGSVIFFGGTDWG